MFTNELLGEFNMKKMFTRRLLIYMLAAFVIVVATIFILRTIATQSANSVTAQNKLEDIKDKLMSNDKNIQLLTDNVSNDNLAKSRAFADMLVIDPTIIGDMDRLNEIKTRLEVSELHIIDEKGIIISSTVPEYLGFDMGSGAQSAAFLEIIKNPSLEIAQEPQMNAAAGIVMQYIGVARKDALGFVQVGVHPQVLENMLASTAVSSVLAEIDYGTSGYIYAVDASDGTILAHKNSELIGKKAADVGFPSKMEGSGTAKINGVRGKYLAEKYSNMIIGAFMPTSEYYGERNSQVLMLAVAMVVVFGALLVLIARYVDSKIISGISSFESGVKRIANGDYDSKMNETGTPEFAQLSDDINKMSANISESFSYNEVLMNKQKQTMENVKGMCEELGKVAEETQLNAEKIFEGTGEQEQAVENLKGIFNRLTDELNNNAEATMSITREMDNSVGGIVQTNEQIDRLNGYMKQIADMSKAIESIITEIDSIADQTNILSINASIEAARAGEAGKGFAVVANEVGSLAQKSAVAAKKTADLITNTIKAVKNGQDMTEQTAKSFGATMRDIENANNNVKSIAEMVKKNVDIVNEASDGMNRISAVVEKNILISQDTKQVSENMTSVSGRLLDIVEE